MGPIMMDVQGTSLTEEDRELLAHPLVGGLILFARNYHDPEQLQALTADIKASAQGGILIAVDHEGGRVQRFREHFSKIPPMGKLLALTNNQLDQAKALAFYCGQLIALEVQSVGVDISFAPVLDLNDISQVIGDRAFANSPELVIALGQEFIAGMHQAGMKVTGKHFPGHGSVAADSHIAMPIDNRSKAQIFAHDIKPFQALIQQQQLDALMPAHVIYPAVDQYSVGFSRYWLQDILRAQLGFAGVIFSDDLSMQGASSIGGYIERAEAAQQAGCDMLLVCNERSACIEVIDQANVDIIEHSQERIQKMIMSNGVTRYSHLTNNSHWQQAKNYLNQYS